MKNLLLIIIVSMVSCSCGVRRLGVKPDKHPKPYLKMAGQQKVSVDTLKARREYVIVNKVKYSKDSLDEYCDGKHEYRRVKSSFAVKKFDGDLAIYTTSHASTSTHYVGVSPGNASGWSTSTHSVTSYYMLKNGTAAMQMLNYDNVEAALAKDEPAYKYMGLYHRRRTAGKITKWAGLGVFATGMALAIGSTSNQMDQISGMTIFSGLMTFVSGFIVKGTAQNLVWKAVAKHNGVRH